MKEKKLKGKVSKNINVNIVFREAEDGSVSAECLEIPGCSVTGRDEEDAKAKIQAAVEGCLEALLEEFTSRATGARVFRAGW